MSNRQPITALFALSITVNWGVALSQGSDSRTAKGTEAAPLRMETCLKLVKWPEYGRETPAVCVVRSGWYLCIFPGKNSGEAGHAPQLRSGDSLFETTILQMDPVHRICLVQQNKRPTVSQGKRMIQETPIPLARAGNCRPGTPLISACPGHSCQTRVAGKDLRYRGQLLPTPLLRVRVEDGSVCQAGTPLINHQGELEGILTDEKMANKKEAHAIPVAVIRKIITDYETFRRTGPVWIGILFQTGTTTPEVVQVRENSPASRGGIQVGDVILEVNSRAVSDLPDLEEIFHGLPAGKKARFKILRVLEEKELSVVPEFAKRESQQSNGKVRKNPETR